MGTESKTLAMAAAALLTFSGSSPLWSQNQDNINALFHKGRSAYYAGKMDVAYQLLSQVAAANPQHFETQALLAQIKSQMKPGGSSLQVTYSSVILAKVDFADVTLQEALQGLSVLSKNASAGKVIPNFIVKSPELNAARVTLSLNNVPLNEVISYLGELTGSKASYDKHAVIFNAITG